jgi:hypothetical protein
LPKKIQETKDNKTKMEILTKYSQGKGWGIMPHESVGLVLTEQGFHDQLLKKESVGGVLKFFENSDQLIKDINGIYVEALAPKRAAYVPPQKIETQISVTPPVTAPSVQETPPPVVKPTGGVSLERPGSLTSGATATGYVEKTVVQKDVRDIPPEKLPPIESSILPAEAPQLGPVKPQEPYFSLGFKPTSPIDPNPSAGGSSDPGAGKNKTTEKPASSKLAAINVQNFLAELGAGINKRIGETKAKSGLGGLLFEMNEIPVVTLADGNFNSDSQKALQAALKTLQKDLELTDEEIYNYTPDVGKKISKAYPKLEKKLSEEQKKKIGGEEGFNKIILDLNSLHKAGQFTNEKLYEGPPVKLTGLGAWIIQGIFDFIGSRFPKAKGLMDGLLVNLTGYSFSELMPGSKHSPELAEIRNEVGHLSTEEQMKALYLKAAQGADGKTSEELKSVVMSGVDTLMHYGDPEQRKAFTQAVSNAFDEAEKQRATATPADAATAFSQTLKTKWGDLPPPSDSSVPHQRPGIEISIDPKLPELEKSLGLKPNTMANTMDKMIALGVEQNGGKERPVLFKSGDTVYVMGVTKDNVLTAVPFTPKDILGLNQAINNVPGADLKSPALEMLTGPRYSHIPLAEIRDRLAPERVKSFPDVEKQVGREYKVWREHVQEEALRPKIDADVAKMREERQAAYAKRGFDITTHTPIDSPGGAGARNTQMSNEALGQHYALTTPVLLKDDYGGRGRVRVLFCDDHNGVRDENGKALSAQELYTKKHDSFKILDITAEYDRFDEEFKKFRETLPKNMDKHTAFDRYRTHLGDNGVDLAAKYPKMASVVFNSDLQRGGVNYAYLMNNGKPDVLALFQNIERDASRIQRGGAYAPEEGGFWGGLKKLFNSKSSETTPPPDWVLDQPKISSKDPLHREERGGVFEERARQKFPEAFKDTPPPPVEVAKADPASTGLVSSDAPPGSKQRAADLFPDNAKMAEREQEFMRQEPVTPAPRANAGITP